MTDYFKSQDSSDLKGESVSGTANQFIGEAVSGVVGIVGIAILARLLTPEAFGLTAMAFAVVGFVGIFSNLGLKSATIQREELQPSHVSSIFWLNLLIAAGLIGICVGLAPLGAWFYEDWRVFGIIAVSSVQFLLSAMRIQHLALLERNLEFRDVMLSGIVGVVASQSSAVGLAWIGGGYWALVVGPLIGQVFETISYWIRCSWRPEGMVIDEDVKSMISFGAYLSLSRLASFFNRNTDDVLLGRYSGASALGLYNRAYKLFTYPMNFVYRPITSVTIPILSRLQDKPSSYRKTYLRILSFVLLVCAGSGVLLTGASDYVVRIVLGSQWDQAAPILALLGAGVIFQPLGKTSGWIWTSQDRTDEAMRFSLLLSTPITVTSFLIGLPWGVYGVALAYVTGSIILDLPLNLWMAHRRGPTRLGDVTQCAAPFLANACVSLGLLLGFRRLVPIESALWGLTACGLFTAFTYGGGIMLLQTTRETVFDGYELVRDHLRNG